MIFICPKCGKSIEVSAESLIASDYFIVCPQCLTRLQIVGDSAVVPRLASRVQKQSPQPAVPSVPPVAPAVPARDNAVKSMPMAPPVPPRYQQPVPVPPMPRQNSQPATSQPYYHAGNVPQSQLPPQSPPAKKNYSCTFTGCLLWVLILLGVLFLMVHL